MTLVSFLAGALAGAFSLILIVAVKMRITACSGCAKSDSKEQP